MRSFVAKWIEPGVKTPRRRLALALAIADARCRPHIARAGTHLQRYPALIEAGRRVAGVWTTLVDAFCDILDPLLSRIAPDVRIVATSVGEALEIHRVEKGMTTRVAFASALDEPTRATLLAQKPREVELRLTPAQVLRRSLSLPVASRDFLQPIIAHRLEHLLPWRPEDVLYGWRILSDTSSVGTVSVDLVAASKAAVSDLVRAMTAVGLAPTVVGIGEDIGQPLGVTIQRMGSTGGLRDSRRIVSRALLAGLIAFTLADLATGYAAGTAVDASEAARVRLVKARRLLRLATIGNVTGPERAMLLAKTPDSSIALQLARLAQTIPQDTYLRELSLSDGKLRLAGTSANAPALVGALERSGLANVRFSAALVRGSDGRDSFEITADRPQTPTDQGASP